MSDTAATNTAVQTSNPNEVHDLLEEIVKLAAVESIVKRRQDQVRAALRAKCDEVQRLTKTAPNLKVKGVGQALITDPEPKAQYDPDEVAKWFEQNRPDRVQYQGVVNAALVLKACEDMPGLRVRLEGVGAVSKSPFVPIEDVEALVAEATGRAGDGSLVTPDGEILPIKMVKRAGDFRITPDKAAVERAAERILVDGLPDARPKPELPEPESQQLAAANPPKDVDPLDVL